MESIRRLPLRVGGEDQVLLPGGAAVKVRLGRRGCKVRWRIDASARVQCPAPAPAGPSTRNKLQQRCALRTAGQLRIEHLVGTICRADSAGSIGAGSRDSRSIARCRRRGAPGRSRWPRGSWLRACGWRPPRRGDRGGSARAPRRRPPAASPRPHSPRTPAGRTPGALRQLDAWLARPFGAGDLAAVVATCHRPRRRVRRGRPRARPPRRGDRRAPLHGRDAAERGEQPPLGRRRRRGRRRRVPRHRPPEQDEPGGRADGRPVRETRVARAIRTLRSAANPAPADGVVPLSPKMVGLRFQAAARAAGVERVTAHSGRVGLASELRSRGASTADVMLAGNWKRSRMVAHYSAGATAERGAVAGARRSAGRHGRRDALRHRRGRLHGRVRRPRGGRLAHRALRVPEP